MSLEVAEVADDGFVVMRATSHFLENVAPSLDVYRESHRARFIDENKTSSESKDVGREEGKESASEDGQYTSLQYEMYLEFSDLFESGMDAFIKSSDYELGTFRRILMKGVQDTSGATMCGLFVSLLEALSSFSAFSRYMIRDEEEGDFEGCPDDEGDLGEGDKFEYPEDDEEGLAAGEYAGQGLCIVGVGIGKMRREEGKEAAGEELNDSYNASFEDDAVGRK